MIPELIMVVSSNNIPYPTSLQGRTHVTPLNFLVSVDFLCYLGHVWKHPVFKKLVYRN
jgi:hypothetical protein